MTNAAMSFYFWLLFSLFFQIFETKTTPEKTNTGLFHLIDRCRNIESVVTDICEQDATCYMACGKDSSPKINHKICSCDSLCMVYKDCCFDFQTQCPNEFVKANSSPLVNLVNAKVKCHDTSMVIDSCKGAVDEKKHKRNNVHELSTKMSKLVLKTSKNDTSSSIEEIGQDLSLENKDQETKRSDDQRSASLMFSEAKQTVNKANIVNSISSTKRVKSELDNDSVEYVQNEAIDFDFVTTDVNTGLTYLNEKVYLECNNQLANKLNVQKWNKLYESEYIFSLNELSMFLANGTSSTRFLAGLRDYPPASVQKRMCPPVTILNCPSRCENRFETITLTRSICETLITGKESKRKAKLLSHQDTERDSEMQDIGANFSSHNTMRTDVLKTSTTLGPKTTQFIPYDNTCIWFHEFNQEAKNLRDFSALLLLNSKAKIVQVKTASYTHGGWNQFRCDSDQINQNGCQLKLSCKQQYVFVDNFCHEIQALLVVLSFRNGLSSTLTFQMIQDFRKLLRKGPITFSDLEIHDVMKKHNVMKTHDAMAVTKIDIAYTYLIRPYLSDGAGIDENSNNTFKDVIEHMFKEIQFMTIENVNATLCLDPYGSVSSLETLIGRYDEDDGLFCEEFTLPTKKRNTAVAADTMVITMAVCFLAEISFG